MKNSLAIAYNLAKHNKKKMAQGGMVENEEMHPMHEPEHEAEEKVKKQYGQSMQEQSYGKLPHPAEMKEHVEPKEENLPGHMFYGPKKIAGDIVNKRMMAKGGMCYAKGGEVDNDAMDEPGMGHRPDYSIDDDFLSAEMSSEVPKLGYPDPDDVEHTEGQGDRGIKRRQILGNIMRNIRASHMGK